MSNASLYEERFVNNFSSVISYFCCDLARRQKSNHILPINAWHPINEISWFMGIIKILWVDNYLWNTSQWYKTLVTLDIGIGRWFCKIEWKLQWFGVRRMVIAEVMISNQKLHQMAQVCGFFHDCDLKLVFNFIFILLQSPRQRNSVILQILGREDIKLNPVSC